MSTHDSFRQIRAACLFVFLLVTRATLAQPECPVPPPLQPVPRTINIFSDEQETYLGDAIAEQIAHRTKLIEDEQLSRHLRSVAENLVQHLPPTKLNYRFYLIDLPEVNAFSIAGGRVYVARKLVAFVHNDDELAGILAHELGHIVTHQSASYMTQRFREVLGVTQLGDRADVTDKFHKYLENAARKPVQPGSTVERHQEVADQVAVFAMARSGYSPQAFVDALDRLQETHGNIGNWLTDLIGFSSTEQHRLREAVKHMSAVPQECIGKQSASLTEDFASWQTLVINYRQEEHKTALPGLISHEVLSSPLRADISYLRFSPDGRYLLAQDESGIYVLTRDPLKLIFHIPTDDIYNPSFSPDSSSIVLYDRYLRVESWSIAEQKRTAVQEVTVRGGCLQTGLSPDGRYLACLNQDFGLSLIDVASSIPVTTKDHFYTPFYSEFSWLFTVLASSQMSNPELIHMGFSPDGRFFLAGYRTTHFAFDLVDRHGASLPSSIKEVTSNNFIFLGPDRIVAVDPSSPSKSPLLRFPSGERLGQLPFTAGTKLGSVAHGDYVLVRPVQDYAVGVFDLNRKNIPAAVKQPAIDVYDGIVVHERIKGELSLDVIVPKQHLAVVQLPRSRLGRLSAAALSPDLRWMAFSNRSRGAIWDLSRNTQIMQVRPFRGAWYGNDQFFYVDFPKFGEAEREIGQLNTSNGAGTDGYKIGDGFAVQYGKYIVIQTPKGKSQFASTFDANVEVRDVRDGQLLWSHYFEHEIPAFSFNSEAMLLGWPLSAKEGHDELQRSPELKHRADVDDYFCEVIDLRKNLVSGKLLVKTNKGSFKVEHAYVDGDWVVISANNNQIMTYSLATGEEKGHFFGTSPLSSSAGGVLAVENQAGQISLYDLMTSQLRQRYVFSDPVSLMQFSSEGKHFVVLTADQMSTRLTLRQRTESR
jgi:WD40 repeat protein